MSTRLAAPPDERQTDFQVLTDPVTGTTARQFGTCGPTSVANALSSARGIITHLQETYSWERAHGDCAQNGSSTLSSGVLCVEGMSGKIAESSGYTAGWTGWWDFILRHAGINPIVVETSIGQVLIDLITGLGENATNLQFHFFAIFGYHPGGVVSSGQYAGRALPEGIFAADGASYAGGNSRANNFNAANQLQFYSKDNLAAAKLCGGFAIVGRPVMLDITTVAAFFSANADGSWHCIGKNVTLRGGMLEYYRTILGQGGEFGMTDLSLPITDEIPVGVPEANGVQPTLQVFERGALFYDPDRVLDKPVGAVGPVYKAHLDNPHVLAVLAPPAPPAPAPVVQFGAAQVTESPTDVTVRISYTAK